MSVPSPPPSARVVARPVRSFAFLLPILAFGLAIYLGASAWMRRGPLISIQAAAGHGIRTGDALRYRGVEIGSVEAVKLARDLTEVLLDVRLEPDAAAVARSGSRFWVVRPHLALDSLEGLETIVGARYLAVVPGPLQADRQREFVALPEPPVTGMDEEGRLEILLESKDRRGLVRGAPLMYRGIQVGSVFSVGLADDARAVEVRAAIRAPYAELVREDTRFWESGGVDVSLGLGGLSVELESVRTLFVGGIALSTPTRPGQRVRTGHRFVLHEEPEAGWLTWQPALAMGSELLPPGTLVPELVRVRHAWEKGLWGWDKSRTGWCLPVSGGLVGPEDVLVRAQGAKERSEVLEFLGREIPLVHEAPWKDRGIARRSLVVPELTAWPLELVRAPVSGEDLLVLGDPAAAPIALAAPRLDPEGSVLLVDPAIVFENDWHGAAVVSRKDGKIVGVLLVGKGRGIVAPAPFE